jgi:hypothetical protein
MVLKDFQALATSRLALHERRSKATLRGREVIRETYPASRSHTPTEASCQWLQLTDLHLRERNTEDKPCMASQGVKHTSPSSVIRQTHAVPSCIPEMSRCSALDTAIVRTVPVCAVSTPVQLPSATSQTRIVVSRDAEMTLFLSLRITRERVVDVCPCTSCWCPLYVQGKNQSFILHGL